MKPSTSLKKRMIPLLVGLAMLLVVIAVAVPTIAYFIRTADLGNDFTPASPQTPFAEGDAVSGNEIAKNVHVNVGTADENGTEYEYPVYVRAYIIVTWQDEYGAVYYQLPKEGTDYELTLNAFSLSDGSEAQGEDAGSEQGGDSVTLASDEEGDLPTAAWVQLGTYYYFPEAVESGKSTSVLIVRCEELEGAVAPSPEYSLHVELIMQTVQAVGQTDEEQTSAWYDAWKVEWPGKEWGNTTEAPEESEEP